MRCWHLSFPHTIDAWAGLTGRELNAARELSADLITLRPGDAPDLEPFMARVRDFVGTIDAHFYTVKRGDTSFVLDRIGSTATARGLSSADYVKDANAALHRTPEAALASDPLHADPRVRNRVVTCAWMLRHVDGPGVRADYRRYCEVFRYAEMDNARVLLWDGGMMMGLVSAAQDAPVHRTQVARLRALVPALRERLRWTALLTREAWAGAALDLAMEELPGASSSSDATESMACERRRASTPDRDPAATRDALRAATIARRDGGAASGYAVTPLAGSVAPAWLCIARSARDGDARAAAWSSRAGLTSREAHALRLLCRGEPNKVIAHRLGVSLRTAESVVARIVQRLGAPSRSAAIAAVMR